jgi:hypothetical protein
MVDSGCVKMLPRCCPAASFREVKVSSVNCLDLPCIPFSDADSFIFRQLS